MFKVQFTVFFVLVGAFLLGIILQVFGGLIYHWTSGSNPILSFFTNLPSNLFSHFIIFPLSVCTEIGGEGKIRLACLIPEALKIMALQAVFYYLLVCTLGGQSRKIQFFRFYFFVFISCHLQMYSNFLNPGGMPTIFYLDIPFTIMASLGLFLLAAQKAMLKPVFWKSYFYIYIAWDLFLTVAQKQFMPILVIQRLLFLLPLYIALYLYAFRTTRNGNKCLLSGKEQPVPVVLKKVIKYGALTLTIFMAAGITYLLFFQTRINEPSECMYKPGSNASSIYSAMMDYYSDPDRIDYPPSIADLCNGGYPYEVCESFSSIEALEDNTTITMIDEDGIETSDWSIGRKHVIRIDYPDCKCPRDIQIHFPEWVDDCVYEVAFDR